MYREAEPSDRDSAVLELYRSGSAALNDGNLQLAETLLLRAQEREPKAPDIRNNLAKLRSLQGRNAEVEALIREIHADAPDYFFGRVNIANSMIDDGELEAAREKLEPLMAIPKLHQSEFRVLATAQIRLLTALGKTNDVRAWRALLDELEAMDAPQKRHGKRAIVRGFDRRGAYTGECRS